MDIIRDGCGFRERVEEGILLLDTIGMDLIF
jgi:hypothetical protein